MILKNNAIRDALAGKGVYKDDSLHIIPEPTSFDRQSEGAASIDLRLGRWFVTLRQVNETHFDIMEKRAFSESSITERHFIPFGKAFVLHPGHFALGVTLEWIKLPCQCAGAVVGKSSWGRRGLIIETAPTVHPGFTGCLTLELTNVGTLPLKLYPGLKICQLQLAKADGAGTGASAFDGRRRPVLGAIKADDFFSRLTESAQAE